MLMCSPVGPHFQNHYVKMIRKTGRTERKISNYLIASISTTDNHPLSVSLFLLLFVLHHPVPWPPFPHRFFTLVLVGFISWCDLCNSNLLVLLSLLTLQQLTKLHQLAMQQTPFTPLGQTTPAFPGTYPRGPIDTSFSLHPEKHFSLSLPLHLISILAQHVLAPVVFIFL